MAKTKITRPNPLDRKCLICNSLALYSEKYDAYYCKQCNSWLEEPCSDPLCEFCSNRPEQPIPIKKNKKKQLIKLGPQDNDNIVAELELN